MENFKKWVARFTTFDILIRILIMLGIVALIMLTDPVWNSIFSKIRNVLKPFVIGFGIAYVMVPISRFFEKFGIKRQLTVPLILVTTMLFLAILLSSIVPKLAVDITSLIVTGFDGVNQIITYISELTNTTPSPIITDVINEAGNILKDFFTNFLNIPNIAGGFIGIFLNLITTSIFSLVIALYVIFDYEELVAKLLERSGKISYKLEAAFIVSSKAIRSYLTSLVIVMGITLLEYTLFYSLTGHSYALMLGILQALGLLIPYVGSISVQVLAILTSLSMPFSNTVMVSLGILVLSNVDSYIISPMVYSKRDKIDPLSSLFVFFASSTIFGFVGLLLSMPLYFSIRAVYNLRANDWILDNDLKN